MRDVLAVLKIFFGLNILKITVEHLPVLGVGFCLFFSHTALCHCCICLCSIKPVFMDKFRYSLGSTNEHC